MGLTARPARSGGGAAGRLAGGRGGGGRRGVLELLLGAEQRVQDLLAQALGERERQARADDPHEHDAAEATAALALLGRLAQRHGGVADRLRRLLEVLLQLLVVEDLLRRR